MTNLEIKRIRKSLNLNQTEFGKILGVSMRTVQSWEAGTRNITETIILLLNNIINSPPKNEVRRVDVKYMIIPFVPVKAQAGFPTGFGDQVYMDELDTVLWEIDDTEYNGTYVVFEIAGDSMDDSSHSSLLAGDKVLCREITRDLWQYKLPINKWNFVLSHPDDGIINCHSLNPYYKDFEMKINGLSAIFSVVDIKRRARI